MLDDDCIYCLETPTTDPNMPKRHCQLPTGDEITNENPEAEIVTTTEES